MIFQRVPLSICINFHLHGRYAEYLWDVSTLIVPQSLSILLKTRHPSFHHKYTKRYLKYPEQPIYKHKCKIFPKIYHKLNPTNFPNNFSCIQKFSAAPGKLQGISFKCSLKAIKAMPCQMFCWLFTTNHGKLFFILCRASFAEQNTILLYLLRLLHKFMSFFVWLWDMLIYLYVCTVVSLCCTYVSISVFIRKVLRLAFMISLPWFLYGEFLGGVPVYVIDGVFLKWKSIKFHSFKLKLAQLYIKCKIYWTNIFTTPDSSKTPKINNIFIFKLKRAEVIKYSWVLLLGLCDHKSIKIKSIKWMFYFHVEFQGNFLHFIYYCIEFSLFQCYIKNILYFASLASINKQLSFLQITNFPFILCLKPFFIDLKDDLERWGWKAGVASDNISFTVLNYDNRARKSVQSPSPTSRLLTNWTGSI